MYELYQMKWGSGCICPEICTCIVGGVWKWGKVMFLCRSGGSDQEVGVELPVPPVFQIRSGHFICSQFNITLENEAKCY